MICFIDANVEVLNRTNELKIVFFQDHHMKLAYTSSLEYY